MQCYEKAIQEQSGELPEIPLFALIKAAKQIFVCASYACKYHEIALAYGRAGVGKTMAVREYMNIHADVVYVAIRRCDNSINAVCKRILKALDKRVAGTTSDLMDAIIDVLGKANRLLVIDEAQHLSAKAIDSLRSLNDEGDIPILFTGNPALYENMFGKQEQDLDQIYSRIGMIEEINDKPLIGDIHILFEGFNLNEKCIAALHNIASPKGGLRRMVKAYRRGATTAASKNEPLTEKHFFS